MPLGMGVGLGPGDFVLDGDRTPSPKRRRSPSIFGPCLLRPNDCMDQDATWTEVGLGPNDIMLDGDPAPSSKRGGAPQFSAHVYCGHKAAWIKMPLSRPTEVGLGMHALYYSSISVCIPYLNCLDSPLKRYNYCLKTSQFKTVCKDECRISSRLK